MELLPPDLGAVPRSDADMADITGEVQWDAIIVVTTMYLKGLWDTATARNERRVGGMIEATGGLALVVWGWLN